MTVKSGRLGRWLAVALAFGAPQAVASPRAEEPPARCERDSCDRACKRARSDLVGVCMSNVCRCLEPVPQ